MSICVIRVSVYFHQCSRLEYNETQYKLSASAYITVIFAKRPRSRISRESTTQSVNLYDSVRCVGGIRESRSSRVTTSGVVCGVNDTNHDYRSVCRA